MTGLPTDPVEIARQLLRQEGENRVLKLRLQEIKTLCEAEWDVDTSHVCQKVINIVDRKMPESPL